MDTTKKIIRGVVNGRGFTITSAITQWDYGWQFMRESIGGFPDMTPTTEPEEVTEETN